MGRQIKKKKKRKGSRIKKFLRFLKGTVILCVIMAGILFGVDYYQTGNVSRTIGYMEVVVEHILTPALNLIGEKTSELTRPAVLWIEEKTEQMMETTADKIEALGGETAENIAEVIRDFSGLGNVESLTEIPAYIGEDYVTVNGNIPVFSEEKKSIEPYEYYSEMDVLGRCGYAEAKLAPELMPTEERGAIGMVRPSGWKTIKYSIIDGLYLYNRCHLIGYQLAGENANEKNLITGTRYMNVTGMLPWENQVADYIQSTGDCVMYRVTPIYEGSDLVARGVQMEAQSLGSNEICFNVFVFNVQPGIEIDYSNGNSWMR